MNLFRKFNLAIYRFYSKTLRFSDRNRKTALALFLGVTLLFLVFVPKMRFLLSTDDLIGDGIPSADTLKILKEEFPEGPSTLLTLTPPEGASSFGARDFCLIYQWLANEKMMNPDLIDTRSPLDIRHPTPPSMVGKLYYPRLIDLDCFVPYSHPDPILEEQKAKSGWLAVQKSPWGFLMSDRTGRDFSVQFTFQETPGFKFGNFDPAAVDRLRNSFDQNLLPKLQAANGNSPIHATWLGTADHQFYTQKGLKAASVLNFSMLIFLLIALRLTYGTWKAGLIYNFTLVVSGIWIYGAKGMMSSPFDVLSNSIFLMIGISTLEDFIFVTGEQLRLGERANWRRSIKKLVIPSFYTSLTTVIGFASLCITDLGIIRRLGFWSAWGAAMEWVLIFLVIPAFLPLIWKGKSWVNPSKARFAQYASTLSLRKFPKLLSWMSLIVYPIGIWAAFHLNVNDSSHLLFPKDHPFRESTRYFEKTRGWLGSVHLLFAPDVDEATQAKLFESFMQEPLVKEQVVAYESVAEELNSFSEGHTPDYKRMIVSDFKTSDAYRRMVAKSGYSRIILYPKTIDVDTLMGMQDVLRNHCKNQECQLTGSLMAYAEFSRTIPKVLLESMISSLFLVIAIIAWIAYSMGQLRSVPALVLSSFWGPAVMFALIGIFQLKVNFLTCIFASVLVGLTGDNGIQYLMGSGKKGLDQGVEERGGSSVVTVVLMSSTAVIFFGSYFDPPKTFGALLAGGLLAALVGDLWILNGLRDEDRS